MCPSPNETGAPRRDADAQTHKERTPCNNKGRDAALQLPRNTRDCRQPPGGGEEARNALLCTFQGKQGPADTAISDS